MDTSLLTPPNLRKTIEKYGKKHGIEPAIVYGVCKKESKLNPFAVRYEPNFKYLFNPEKVLPPICSLSTEITLQKTSFGLMQIMGATARELGFKGWLTEFFTNPDVQLEFGCRYLASKIKKYGLKDGIMSYNTGSPAFKNISYVEDVLKFSKEFETFGV